MYNGKNPSVKTLKGEIVMKRTALFIYGTWMGIKMAIKAAWKVLCYFLMIMGVISCLAELGLPEEEEES